MNQSSLPYSWKEAYLCINILVILVYKSTFKYFFGFYASLDTHFTKTKRSCNPLYSLVEKPFQGTGSTWQQRTKFLLVTVDGFNITFSSKGWSVLFFTTSHLSTNLNLVSLHVPKQYMLLTHKENHVILGHFNAGKYFCLSELFRHICCK